MGFSIGNLQNALVFSQSRSRSSLVLMGWKLHGMDKRKAWRLALLCLFWCVWREQNNWTFKQEELLDQKLKETFIKSLTRGQGHQSAGKLFMM